MSFNIIAIREIGDTDEPEMYPLLTGERLLAFDQEDGADPLWTYAKALSVRESHDGGSRQILGISDILADVIITDGRVAVVCVKFDKGGGWWGSPLVSVLFNLVSIVRARIRSRGKALVGHVRHNWLVSVGFSPKNGLLDINQVRLVLKDGTVSADRTLYFDMTFDKRVGTAEIARDICHRVARQRLTHSLEMAEEERAAFERLAKVPRLADPEPGTFASYAMPSYWPASLKSADISELH